ncbi:MAG TPA: serine/threonine-protein kinase [Thermodesulfobacteriota bacterium]|nr:serine/threonine-protein kinase [Thermodesulfobacteriota bacterium]
MVGKEVGSYRLLEKIGQGGMGIVYKGIHITLEQEVAIKVLSPQFSEDPNMRKRFIKEARIQAKFSHPNVVNLLNYVEEEDEVFLIMEFVNGETLEKRLRRENALAIEEAVSISSSVLQALDFMHSKGVIHRDIKPSNIMFTESGLVKVTDFGIAKVIGEKALTKTGLVGTFRYMSPELILGEETSVASDVYSFGITFYEMLTGTVPFNSDSEYKIMKGHLEEKPLPPWEINNKVSRKLGKVILKALAKNPEDRYENVRDFARDMETAIKKPKWSNILPQRLGIRVWELHSDKKSFLVLAMLAIMLISVFPILKKAEDSESFEAGKTSSQFESSLPDSVNPGMGVTHYQSTDHQIEIKERYREEAPGKDASLKTINNKLGAEEELPAGETKKASFQKAGSLEKSTENKYEKIEMAETGTLFKNEEKRFSKPNKKDRWNIRK